MNKYEIAQIIRDVRNEKGINIETLSIATKIPSKYIEAIEEEDFDSIPPGPYYKLYTNTILKELDIDVESYKQSKMVSEKVEEEKEVPNKVSSNIGKSQKKEKESIKEIVKEEIVSDEKSENIEKSKIPYVLIIILVFLLSGLYLFVSVNNKMQRDQERESFVKDSIENALVQRENFITDSIARVKFLDDSIKSARLEFQKDSLARSEDNSTLEKKSGWRNPPYKQISTSSFSKLYENPVNPLLKLKATRGYIKVKYFSKDEKWWKRVNYGDSLFIYVPKAASVQIYNVDNCDGMYKGEKIDFEDNKFVQYLFTHTKSYMIQRIFS